nr:ABC-F family ATP-binding cassette domain-containing protein [uncultured Blautia sp.]
MNILNMEHISKVYGDKVIFDDISVGIHQGDKIGIIGINGTGKTTFLRILAGLEEADEGQVVRQNGLRLSYLSQHPQFPEGATILSYVSEGKREEDWNPETDAHMVLNKLGIADHEEEIAHLSGGQKKRVALARVLINPADLLILDEPTNHLDNEMAAWLEDYLNRFKGAVIMVTHDRYFLDRVTNKILEISHGKTYTYEAKYSKFLEMKAEREEMEMASERKRQSVLRMELEWAKRGCRARTTKQRARLERLEALKNGTAPVRDKSVEIDSVETRMGKKTIELHHISKSFGEKVCIRDFDYIVLKNQRLGIIGPNGCGKSTLLKIIAGILEPDSGHVETGETIRMGYFSQEIEEMNTSQRVIDYIRDVAEYIPTKDGLISAAKLLEQFLFDSSMQYSPIEKLSGGEKKRLYLLKILAAAPNVLLLDEITNDIDIPTLTILEDYLDSFAGIVIAVSHDRYFLDNLADRIFEFDRDGNLTQYEGGYTDYLESKKRRFGDTSGSDFAFGKKEGGRGSGENDNASASGEKDSVKTWKQNRTTKLKFSFKEQREYETIDDDIAKLETKLEKLDADIMANATNSGKLNELTREKEEAEALLEEKMDRWVYLNDLAERIEAQNNG